MVTTAKVITVLDELKAVLSDITAGATYNYTYNTVVRGQIHHASMAVDTYPTIEIRQLNIDDKILANRTFERGLNIYIIATQDIGSDFTDEERENIVEKMKQDILNRMAIGFVDQEFTVLEHFEPTREDNAIIENFEKVQAGIAMTLIFKNLYNAF